MKLDQQQQAAVESTAQKTMVVAGPGSGKTRVLVERIAHLIGNGASPYEICSFSFTRKSAMELKSRLVERIGKQAHNITCGTSHSVALEMIRRFDQRRAHYSVYGEMETQMVLKDVAEEMGVYKKTWKIPKRDIDAALLEYAAHGSMPHGPHAKLIDAFWLRLRQNRAFTYDDLLIEFLKIVPELSKYLNWAHVLVDECQDLTPLQWDIVNAISRHFQASIFAVGDPDQQIFSFRGSDSAPMMRAEQDGYQVFLLENNYRSLPEIVNVTNNVIRHNQNRIPKYSVPTRIEPALPECLIVGLQRVHDTVQIHRDVDSAMISEIVSSYCGGEIAVLARNHYLLQKVSRLLSDMDVAHIYAGQKNNMLKELPAVTVHSFLRLLCNHHDNFSFMVIRKLLGVDDREYAEIRYHAVKNGMSHLETWMEFSGVLDSSNFFRHFDGSDRVTEAVDEIMTGPVADVLFGQQILDFISQGAGDNLFATIRQYLDYIATFDVQDELTDPDAPPITLSTIHAAKGLEFKTVIVAGMNEGIFPGARAEAAGEIADETNLAFVAFSRAEDRLILTVRPEKTIDTKGAEHINPVSRFIEWTMK